ncbi:Copine [Carpediemonas membranifera]|uniref:Copine n=1 Tax=Carpediemonas membranifera TaxID=201153 RepID=A0A8J6AV30_9EUKA|nr:Copine [Carpediemonas membranifera]|eukprot:KAG9395506.1 Copine [Carpediemonas membranifera]
MYSQSQQPYGQQPQPMQPPGPSYGQSSQPAAPPGPYGQPSSQAPSSSAPYGFEEHTVSPAAASSTYSQPGMYSYTPSASDPYSMPQSASFTPTDINYGAQAMAPDTQVTSMVELSLACINLPNLDVLSKTDAVIVAYEHNAITHSMKEVGRTEVIKDSLNPRFVRKIKMPYYFEMSQNLVFRAYDIDDWKHINDMSKQEHIGDCRVSLAAIINAPKQMLTTPLRLPSSKKGRGELVITAEQLTECDLGATFRFRVSGLPRTDLFGSCDPFIEIRRTMESGGSVVVWKSEYHKRKLKVAFNETKVDLVTLCNGDRSRTLIIAVLDWNRSGSHEFIGQVELNVDQLEEAGRQGQSFTFKNPRKSTPQKRQKSRGKLIIDKFTIHKVPTFFDFLRRGLQLHLSVAIDFTASNGNPADSRSLHYMGDPNRPNEYQQAIRSVGEVLAPYEPNGIFTALGFGAALQPANRVSHCFNLAPGDGTVAGPIGIEQVYKQALASVRLSGPTLFGPIIETCRRRALQRGPGHYDVLLIITDGVVTDVQNSIRAVVAAGKTPMSIIIVGVGREDFTQMEVLDADEEPLITDSGERMVRDIVQFVPMRHVSRSQQMVAAETLQELPRQVVDWYELAQRMGVPFLLD